MNKYNNPKLTKYAQELRKNMTKEELKLWCNCLKNSAKPFHRQKVIGSYIVDFYCASAKVVVEIDGTQHYLDDGIESDTVRDEYLKGLGLTVLRYSNYEINEHFDSVCADIMLKIGVIEEI